MENVRTYRDIKLVTKDKRRNQLVLQPNYHTTKWFSENLLAIEMKKIKIKINTPVYLGFPISEISKSLMYEFWYYYTKKSIKAMQNYAHGFIINIKTEDFYEDIANDFEKRFNT